jgi:glucose/arabinose dehydrogenase
MTRPRILRPLILLGLVAAIGFAAWRAILHANAVSAPVAIEGPLASAAIERAFPNLRLERPVGLTFPPDNSNRLAVISQYGSVYLFPNQTDVEEPIEALNIRDNVAYKDSSNEEGLLGIVFHTDFRNNRQFFLYYTNAEHHNVLSRFTMLADDPNRADPNSELIIFRPDEKASWNHNGGTILFGPEGFLYIAVGDGGPVNDPNGRGQDITTTLGKVLRIDVDHPDGDRNYSIPKDNPFVDVPGARGEIWALGLRNVWRMAFDMPTKRLWAGDVGQDTWEEVDLIERGGNYGWSVNEGFRKFTAKSEPKAAPVPSKIYGTPIAPLFAYNHSVGNCIVGGCIYRGSSCPSLVGDYLFADYVTGQVYAMRYDDKSGTATSVHKIGATGMPILSFGEDESGEVYFTTTQGFIHHFIPNTR